jgi:hypothetical protein
VIRIYNDWLSLTLSHFLSSENHGGQAMPFHQIRRLALTQRHITPVHCGPIAPGLCAAMLPEAKKYHAYARECLELAEQTDSAETQRKLIELSRVWMEAALREEGILTPRSSVIAPVG